MKLSLKLLSIYLVIVWAFSNSCQKELTCYTCNKPPLANAGSDRSITIPVDTVLLDGSASNDLDGAIKEWLWTKLTGPAGASISNATRSATSIKNLVAGIYAYELKVTDDLGLSATDTVQMVVVNPLINQRPVANAGPDQSITLPTNNITLNAGTSTDPDNNISTYAWSAIAAPGAVNIANAGAAVTQVSGLVQGVYQFNVKVVDEDGLFSNDTVKVTVTAATIAANCGESNRPVLNAMLVPFGKLSEAASGLAVAAAGNKIVFAGAALWGNPPNYGSSTVDIFDINTQAWSSATLSKRRTDISALAAGNKIFLAGGRLGESGSDEHFTTVDIFDVSTNTWSVANLSQARAYIAVATVGNKVFFAGGEREWPYPVSDRVDVYNLDTDTWTTTTLSEPRNGITAVTVNNKIYFAGGSNQVGGSNNVTNVIDIYDNATNSWSVSTLTEPKSFFTGTNVGSKIYWGGGYTALGIPSCKVQISDVNSRTSSTTFLSQPFAYIIAEGQNAVVKNNSIIWFTTIDPLNGNATDKFNIYNIASNTWSIGLLPFRLTGASVISVNNTIYVAGGSVNGRLTNDVWKLEF